MSWHAEPELLAAYAGRSIGAAHASSVEAHLLACAVCRRRVAALVDAERLERVWAAVEADIDAPPLGPVERVLLSLRAPEDTARLLAATPSLSMPWLLAVCATLAFAALAAQQGDGGVLAFLVLAPLLPVAGVMAAYAPGLDPAYELALASPMRGFRLLLLRAAAVVGTTIPLAAAGALALPGLDWTVAAWLVPSLALTLLSLALSTYAPPLAVTASLAGAWVAAVLVGAVAADDRLAAFRAPAQVGLLLAGLLAAVVVVRRRERFDVVRAA